MSITIREARGEEVEALVPLLLAAEPSERALRWSLENLSDAVYRMDDDDAEGGGRTVAAATVRWRRAPAEIIEMAVAEGRRGRGFGRHMVEWLVEEARRRGLPELLVGTSSANAGNLIFYQKCGFRPDHVRRDYFWYYDEPVVENGITVRDMLVFRRALDET